MAWLTAGRVAFGPASQSPVNSPCSVNTEAIRSASLVARSGARSVQVGAVAVSRSINAGERAGAAISASGRAAASASVASGRIAMVTEGRYRTVARSARYPPDIGSASNGTRHNRSSGDTYTVVADCSAVVTVAGSSLKSSLLASRHLTGSFSGAVSRAVTIRSPIDWRSSEATCAVSVTGAPAAARRPNRITRSCSSTTKVSNTSAGSASSRSRSALAAETINPRHAFNSGRRLKTRSRADVRLAIASLMATSRRSMSAFSTFGSPAIRSRLASSPRTSAVTVRSSARSSSVIPRAISDSLAASQTRTVCVRISSAVSNAPLASPASARITASGAWAADGSRGTARRGRLCYAQRRLRFLPFPLRTRLRHQRTPQDVVVGQRGSGLTGIRRFLQRGVELTGTGEGFGEPDLSARRRLTIPRIARGHCHQRRDRLPIPRDGVGVLLLRGEREGKPDLRPSDTHVVFRAGAGGDALGVGGLASRRAAAHELYERRALPGAAGAGEILTGQEELAGLVERHTCGLQIAEPQVDLADAVEDDSLAVDHVSFPAFGEHRAICRQRGGVVPLRRKDPAQTVEGHRRASEVVVLPLQIFGAAVRRDRLVIGAVQVEHVADADQRRRDR